MILLVPTVSPLSSQDLDSRGAFATTKHGHFRISENLRRGAFATTAVGAPSPPQLKFRRGAFATTEAGR
jgi:hypothetical protein